jgi:hypothetical protein
MIFPVQVICGGDFNELPTVLLESSGIVLWFHIISKSSLQLQ